MGILTVVLLFFSYDGSGRKWKGGLAVRKVLFVGDGHVRQDGGSRVCKSAFFFCVYVSVSWFFACGSNVLFPCRNHARHAWRAR